MKKGLLILTTIFLYSLLNLQSTMAINLVPDTIVVADEDVKYKEIKTTELPAIITESVQKSYAEYTIAKAYLGSDGTYKVKLTKEGEGDSKIAYYSATGELQKAQEAKQEMKDQTE